MEDTPRLINKPILEIVKRQIAEPLAAQEECAAETLDAAQAIIDEAHEQARSIVEEAKHQASIVMDEALGQAEELKTKGRDEGYQAGYQEGILQGKTEGLQQGLQEGQQEFCDKIQQANTIILKAQEEAKETIISAERQIIDIALKLAGKILASEIEENSMVVMPIVKKALEKVRDQEQITIKVNPQDYERVQDAKLDLQVSAGCDQCLTVFADETVGVGGCVIDTANGLVDAKIDTQFELLKKAMQDNLP